MSLLGKLEKRALLPLYQRATALDIMLLPRLPHRATLCLVRLIQPAKSLFGVNLPLLHLTLATLPVLSLSLTQTHDPEKTKQLDVHPHAQGFFDHSECLEDSQGLHTAQ